MSAAKIVKVAAIQTKVSANLDANLKKTVEMVKRAAKQGAQIICLQELFNIPYIPQKQGMRKDDYAEIIPGETTRVMGNLAGELGVVLIVPIFEKAKNAKTRSDARSGYATGWKYYNTAVVFDDRGKMLGKYHKIHIPQDPGFYEKDYFEAGQSGYKIFKTKFGTFAVLICYDQWFPEAARAARLAGAKIIFYPTALGNIIGYKAEGDWHDAWETSMRGHAIANSLYVIATNRVGREGRMEFFGQSFIADPFGKIIKRASSGKEEILTAKIDLSRNKFFAEGWGFLRNRRPDTYKNLLDDRLVTKSKKLKNVGHYQDEKRALEK